MVLQGRGSRLLAAGVMAAAALTLAAPAYAVPVVVTTMSATNTATDLANLLAGSGVTISNVSYTGSDTSGGSFTGGGTAPSGVIGFDRGVVLSSGLADIGSANTDDGQTGEASQTGDADLDALGAGFTQDTTVLEFDVTPNQSTLYFNYVFASEEYNEYVYSFNDVFGFLVTQAGSTTKQNCAVLADGPDTGTEPDLVSVDSINGGNPYGDANASHPELYRNNDLSDGGGSIPAEPDGFTTVLQCVATVVPNQANHVKLAISDVGDSALDSWVFIQAGSISTQTEICGDGIDNDGDGQVDEGCAVNQPPTVGAGGPYTGNEGAAIGITGTKSDPDGDPVTTTWSYAPGAGVDTGATCAFADATALSTTVTCTDDGLFTLTLSGNDGHHTAVTSSTTLTVANVAPTTSITAPGDMSVHQVGSAVNLSATESDAGSNDVLSCSIDWGDGSVVTPGTSAGGACTGSHTYTAIGTYDVTVTVTDDDGASGTDMITVVVADGSVKVTGGGFVMDGGRYSFGFVAKSGSGGTEGQLSARNHAGKHRFHGDSVSSLIASGTTATWSGGGRFDNAGGYTFAVTVTDNGTGKKKGSPDTIDLTVRAPGGSVVLHFAGPLKGGNITVH